MKKDPTREALKAENEQLKRELRAMAEKSRVEQALKESERKYRQFFEESPVSLWEQDFSALKAHLDRLKKEGVTDIRGYFEKRPEQVKELARQVRIIDLNQATLRIYRAKSKSELLSGISKVFIEESYRGFIHALVAIAEGETLLVEEKRHQTLDGDILHIQLRWSVAQGYEKSYARVLVSILDITELKRTELALRESEERYRFLFNKMINGFVLCRVLYDENGAAQDLISLEINPAYERITGFGAHQVLGKRATRLLPNLDPEWFDIFYRIDRKGESILRESYLSDLDIWLRIAGFPVKPGHIGFTIEDITREKRALERQEKLENQIRHMQKMEAMGTMAGGIAHEFNNMLGIILGNAELGMDELSDDHPSLFNLRQIEMTTLRARDVVKQLIRFSHKMEEGERTICDMRTVLSDAMKLLRPLIPVNIEILEAIAAHCPPIKADAAQLHQLIINMGTNAIHAMQEKGGELQVTLNEVQVKPDREIREETLPLDLRAGHYVRLILSDTGSGIPQENLGRIFDPYFTTKEIGTGSGMGLAVVHGIVNGHGGGIHVNSIPGRGTDFHVFLPAAPEKPPENLAAVAAFPRGRERILFVDDERPIVEIGRYRLIMLGYEVAAYTEPSKAFAAFSEAPHDFDLLITDMTMPEMTGDILVQKVRKIRPDMKILLCTGYSDRMDPRKAARLGIGYLMKPISRKAFAEVVRQVLDGKI